MMIHIMERSKRDLSYSRRFISSLTRRKKDSDLIELNYSIEWLIKTYEGIIFKNDNLPSHVDINDIYPVYWKDVKTDHVIHLTAGSGLGAKLRTFKVQAEPFNLSLSLSGIKSKLPDKLHGIA